MIPELKIRRYGTGWSGTFGRVWLEGGARSFGNADGSDDGPAPVWSLEEQWKENARGISCIPAGRYRAVLYRRPSNDQVAYLLQSVPGRTGILIHAGNTEEDTLGCILLGFEIGNKAVADEESANGERAIKGAVLRSREAIAALMAATVGAAEIVLDVQWEPGVGESA